MLDQDRHPHQYNNSANLTLLAQREPKLIVAEMAKVLRAGKVFIDWSQNSDFKTTVGVCSLRAKSHKPWVSLPVTWNELKGALDGKDARSLYFTPEVAIERVVRLGDLFKEVRSKKQQLPHQIQGYFSRAPSKRRSVPIRRTTDQRKDSPSPNVRRSRQGSRRRFVVQKGKGNRLLRTLGLEMNGVSTSWSLPTGVPLQEGSKRAATILGDRPLDDFKLNKESTVERASWDNGTYELIEGSLQTGLLRIYLRGTKLKGEWQLRKTDGNSG
jgi:bifunctional non-homologous end joining protein LigD